jgi:cytochrome c
MNFESAFHTDKATVRSMRDDVIESRSPTGRRTGLPSRCLDAAHCPAGPTRQNGAMRIVLVVLASILALPAQAADPEVAAGRKIAQRCKSCHAIGLKGASPDKKAPPFRFLARKYPLENLQEGFAEGIVIGHSEMPNFRLSPPQIENFLAYLHTIQR